MFVEPRLDQSHAGENKEQEQRKKLEEKVRRAEPVPAMSGYTPHCLSLSALWSPL